MVGVERGIACPGCPHRTAYVACKEALGRGAGRVICGNAGCAAVGAMHPAATACPGGEEALLPRYRQAVPTGGTAEAPASERCIHFALDTEAAAEDAEARFADLATEGRSTVLAVLASSRAFLTREAIERLGDQALALGAEEAVVVDPFDTLRSEQVLDDMLERPGVHAVVFASPCARLLKHGGEAGTQALEPVEIDRYACVGCHRCKQITGCPALSFTPPFYQIDAQACAGCDLCTSFCRTHVIYSPRDRYTPEERSRMRYAACQR